MPRDPRRRWMPARCDCPGRRASAAVRRHVARRLGRPRGRRAVVEGGQWHDRRRITHRQRAAQHVPGHEGLVCKLRAHVQDPHPRRGRLRELRDPDSQRARARFARDAGLPGRCRPRLVGQALRRIAPQQGDRRAEGRASPRCCSQGRRLERLPNRGRGAGDPVVDQRRGRARLCRGRPGDPARRPDRPPGARRRQGADRGQRHHDPPPAGSACGRSCSDGFCPRRAALGCGRSPALLARRGLHRRARAPREHRHRESIRQVRRPCF